MLFLMGPFDTQSSNLCILLTRDKYILTSYHGPGTELGSVEKTKLNEASHHPASRSSQGRESKLLSSSSARLSDKLPDGAQLSARGRGQGGSVFI